MNGVINNPAVSTWNGTVAINDTNNVSDALASYTRAPGETVLGGPYAILTASFGPLSGPASGNYIGPSIYGGGTVLNINPATLIPSLQGIVSKVYDATVTAALVTGNYQLAGIVGVDNVYITNTAGTYASKDTGTNISVSVTSLNLAGTAASNYVLSTTVAVGQVGTITPATLTVSNITANNKIYDALTTATLNLNSAQLTGIYAGDTASVDPIGYIANFITPNVGSNIPVNVANLGLTGASASDYLLTQPTGLAA